MPSAVSAVASAPAWARPQVAAIRARSPALAATTRSASVKVILSGKIERKVALKGVNATKGAKAAIEAAGGSVA